MTTTQLAPRYDPSAIESDIYRRWMDAGVFSPTPGGRPYVIVIPPPNVTDRLHMGHGLNNTLQDVLIRFERMRGRETLWLPGTDHAGIATQNVVERLLAKEGTTRHDLGREAFVARVRSYVEATGGTILKQLEAIGASCDWSRTRYTLDEAYSVAVRKVFVDLFHEGLIYRGHRVIHWCPRCLTALSDEEAEFHERDGEMFYIRYPVEVGAERQSGRAAGEAALPSAPRPAPRADGEGLGWVTVATTRPETMFGDIALVYHPDDARYAGFESRRVCIPLSNVPIPIRLSTAVEREFGTGMLKVTPAHDPNDFDIAGTLDPDSERPVVLTEDARMADDPRVPEAFRGLDREAARTAIVERLRDAGLLERTEPHRHAVRQCYRCNTVIEPRLSEQWFVRMEPLAAPALTAYGQGRLQILPERWGKIYRNWLENIRDWNISRQLWWGHRVPAFYCERCSHITVAMDDPAACAACGGAVRQDEDVLDTWFSSWLWPFATLGWPERTPDLARYYPGHTLSTAAEIIFFWVARMVMAGYHFLGERPFETVFIHGTVRDTLHRKMSKSLGNGIDPLAVVERYGADALRFTVIAGAPLGTDVILDPDDLETSFAPGRNFANKLWNVGRLILSHFDGECPPLALDSAQFELADRWILSRCQRAVADTTEALERFRLNDAANRVYHFLWDELADWYLEQVKPRLYGEAQGGHVARGILCRVLETTLRLLHPVMPFITEELWGHIPGEREPLLATAAWPVVQSALVDDEAEDRFGRVQALITTVRTIRAEYGVPPSATVHAHVQPASPETVEALNAEQRTIVRLAKIGRLRRDGRPEDVGAHDVLPDGTSIFVPLGDAIDVAQECGRLRRERERLDELLRGVAHKLANRQFVERAPADVVEREREKQRSWREQRDGLAEKLLSLGCR
jgi:valyl-tRNA synthetase